MVQAERDGVRIGETLTATLGLPAPRWCASRAHAGVRNQFARVRTHPLTPSTRRAVGHQQTPVAGARERPPQPPPRPPSPVALRQALRTKSRTGQAHRVWKRNSGWNRHQRRDGHLSSGREIETGRSGERQPLMLGRRHVVCLAALIVGSSDARIRQPNGAQEIAPRHRHSPRQGFQPRLQTLLRSGATRIGRVRILDVPPTG